jgi:hypothetical protein
MRHQRTEDLLERDLEFAFVCLLEFAHGSIANLGMVLALIGLVLNCKPMASVRFDVSYGSDDRGDEAAIPHLGLGLPLGSLSFATEAMHIGFRWRIFGPDDRFAHASGELKDAAPYQAL